MALALVDFGWFQAARGGCDRSSGRFEVNSRLLRALQEEPRRSRGACGAKFGRKSANNLEKTKIFLLGPGGPGGGSGLPFSQGDLRFWADSGPNPKFVNCYFGPKHS